jgi:NACHT domain
MAGYFVAHENRWRFCAMTGFEPVLAAAAGRGAAKALGWGTRLAKNKIDDRRTQARLEMPVTLAGADEIISALPPESAQKLDEYIHSPELENMAFTLANQRMFKACGKGAEERIHEVRREAIETVRLITGMGTDLSTKVGNLIFDQLDQQVIASLAAAMSGQEDPPPMTRAAIIKTAASMASAAARNASLLAQLGDVAEYRNFEQQLRQQISRLHATMRLPHAGTSRQVRYERLFVQPTVVPTYEVEREVAAESESLLDVLEESLRLVLLGDPGGGKSTSSLKLTYDIATGGADTVRATVPFLVILRDYVEQFASNRLSILDYLSSLCETPYGVVTPDGAIDYLLLNGRAFVIFDGLDELLDTSLRREVVQVVEGFAYRYPLTPILVTSRRVGYDDASLDSDMFPAVQLQQFGRGQVEAYVKKWFNLDDSVPSNRKVHMTNGFLRDSEFVSDLRANPLLLSLMCGLYASESYIPRNRPDVYEKCALLLFDRWDKQRGINAPLSFDAHVQAAMRSLALWIYPRQESQQGIPRAQLIAYMTQYLLAKRFDNEEDAEQAATEFIDFCKGRAWVLTDIGAELYGFTHRTFLEYFAANQLVRLNPNAQALVNELWPRIVSAEWDVLAQLAVQILGKTVEDGADDFLDALLQRLDVSHESPETINSLSFACRALEFIVPRPSVLRNIVETAVNFERLRPVLEHDAADPALPVIRRPVGDLMSVTAENLPIVARYMREALAKWLEEDPMDERGLMLALYPTNARSGPAARDLSPVDGSFWQEQTVENRQVFDTVIKMQAQRHAWVASDRVTHGEMRCGELVRQFGVRSLYDYQMAGQIVVAPIAYVILHESVAPSRHSRTWLQIPLLRELIDVLLEHATPWIARDMHYQRLGYLERMLPSHGEQSKLSARQQLLRSAAILLALPLIELGRDRGLRGSRGPDRELSPDERPMAERWRLFGFFADVYTEEQAGSTALSTLNLSPAVERFVASWLEYGINVVDAKPSGRLVAEAGPHS